MKVRAVGCKVMMKCMVVGVLIACDFVRLGCNLNYWSIDVVSLAWLWFCVALVGGGYEA